MKERIFTTILTSLIVFATISCSDANDELEIPGYIVIGGERISTAETVLELSGNLINADIEPLRYMVHLADLTIIGTRISDISSLAGLTNLTKLELRSPRISDIGPLAKIANLSQVLLDIPLVYEQVEELQKARPDIEIHAGMIMKRPLSEWVISEPLGVRPELENGITMEVLDVCQEANQVTVKIANNTEYRVYSTANPVHNPLPYLHFFDGEHWVDVPRYVEGRSDAAAFAMRPNSYEIVNLTLWGYYNTAGAGLYKVRIGFFLSGDRRPHLYHDVVAEFQLNYMLYIITYSRRENE